MEQGLYTQVVMIIRRESYYEKYIYIYNFQGQSARTKRWFGLDHEWLEETFMTREPDFY